ncbi:hypothetical protein C4588_06745 [Candidatus Parcubacteria bacterium]|nr:MAG: hypothetical protein C4588_06745 [Candidatus Parcubacteria bacterium]
MKNTFVYDVVVYLRQLTELLLWRLKGTGITPHIVKQKVVLFYAARFSISTLIETGTYLGFMVNAVKREFRQIYSVELDEKLYQRAKNKFRRFDHIVLFQGDSAVIIPRILSQIQHACLFWLDAHYSGGITAKEAFETPILQELRHILSHPLAPQHVILIDDARNFAGANDYPTLQEVEQLVSTMCSTSVMSVSNDIIRIHRAEVKV